LGNGALAAGELLLRFSFGLAICTFDSEASNLVQGDTNRRRDVFVRGPLRSAKRPKR
jgi:hypothetical protein